MKSFSFDRRLLAVNNRLFTLKINNKLYKLTIYFAPPLHTCLGELVIFSPLFSEEAFAWWGKERKKAEGGRGKCYWGVEGGRWLRKRRGIKYGDCEESRSLMSSDLEKKNKQFSFPVFCPMCEGFVSDLLGYPAPPFWTPRLFLIPF